MSRGAPEQRSLGTVSRLRILTLLILLFALLLGSRLYFIQIISGESLRAKAEHQYIAGVSYFDRGSIFFSTKDGTLIPGAAVNTGFTLSINPKVLSKSDKVEEIYQKLNTVIPIEREVFLAKVSKIDDPYEEVAKRLEKKLGEEISALKLPGVAVSRERWRYYPGGQMAAHALGLIGYSDTGADLRGRYGLERSYENVLKREGDEVFVNFFAEIFSNIKSVVEKDAGLESDIITSIEPSVEAFLENELKSVGEKYASELTGGIVIDPNTGEIIAMGVSPAFDPNFPQNEESSAIFSNPLVENRYEMGSIVKALTFAVALDKGAVTAKTTYNDPGCQTLNTKTFCNYDLLSHGTSVTMQEVLNNSLNTGAAFAALRVGPRAFRDAFFKFGINARTSIDLPNEGNSLTSNLDTLRELETAQASFGQGIALTPAAITRALSALANGGTLITPHLVKEVRYKIGGGKTLEYKSKGEGPRAISKEASTEISRMLTEVVDRSLRFGSMRLENYSIAAKTGTAQIASPGGGYYADRFLHSFFGYFPSYDPRFLVFLFTYEPKGAQFASETLTDSFFNTAKFLITYYDIPPDRTAAPPAPVAGR
ncbi:MAG TPA: penicillin-binding protein 2 [Candidatus Paceibacterota bacterium]